LDAGPEESLAEVRIFPNTVDARSRPVLIV
jgi:hypothetical protein